MTTVEKLEAQARNAQKRLNDARKRADEKLGKRLRELVAGEDKINREAQVDRAHAFLDEFFGDEDAQGEQQQREEDAQHDERQEHGEYGEHADGQQYGGSEYE